MECFCGCGRNLGRDQHELGLQAGVVAVELLAWDKARTLWGSDPRRPLPPDEVDCLIARGADVYQRAVLRMHGEDESLELSQVEEWLKEAETARRAIPSMTKTRWLTSARTEPLLDEYDVKRLNRTNPELSYSGGQG